MTKIQLLETLKKELSFLPADELESRLAFYSEMIDDRMEEGLSEEEALKAIGSIDEIIDQLKSEYAREDSKNDNKNPYCNGTYETPKNKKERKTSAWVIILIALGSPMWLSLGAVALAVIITIYAVLWAITGSLWAVPSALAGVCLGGLATGVVSIAHGNALVGITLIGAAIACAGLAIFAGFACFHLTRLAVFLSKIIARFIKSLFVRKEKKNA